jgi:geranylgeranylglycerol-phosphate geranylgeranyltransferase
MRLPSALLALIRWENALLSACGVLVGAWWAGAAVLSTSTLLAALAAMALTAVANAENDYQDRDIDRVAHPGRPLPRGALRPEDARTTVAVAAVISIASSLALGIGMAVATVAIIAVMLIYSRVLKARGVLGNVTVGLLASLPFLYGAWSAGRPFAALPLVGVAIPLHVAREIAKDLEDADADARTRRTLPVAHGAQIARVVLAVALGLFIVMLWPLIAERPRLGGFVMPALLLVGLAAARAWRGRRGSPSLFKAAMACAMASLVLAYWPR